MSLKKLAIATVFLFSAMMVWAKPIPNGEYEIKSKRTGTYGSLLIFPDPNHADFQRFFLNVSQSFGETVNFGELYGQLKFINNQAIFIYKAKEEYDFDCNIKFTYRNKKLILDQNGSCGMGLNVSSSGTYRFLRAKISQQDKKDIKESEDSLVKNDALNLE